MRKKLYSIQVLRGIAALFIVVLHAYVHLEARKLIPEVPSFVNSGRAGVDIFFVISGFIMVYISGDKFGKKGAVPDFLTKRIIRVVPIYWVYTLLMAAFLFFAPHLFSQGKSFDFHLFLASLLFIPWQDSLGYIKPVLQVGWTLNYEMYFYLVFATLLLFSARLFPILMMSILLSGFLVGQVVDSIHPIFSVMTSSLLMEFLMGCFIGIVFSRFHIDQHESVGVMMLFVGSLLLVLTGLYDVVDVSRTIKWGVPSAIILTGAILLENRAGSNFHHLLTKLGDSSYSLYLTHIFTINAIGKIWHTFFGSMYDVFIVVAVVTSVIAGYIAHVVLEKPLISYLNKLYSMKKNKKPDSYFSEKVHKER